MHHHDIFYSKEDMTFEEKVKIINSAKEKAYEWWVDKLDCNESFARQRIEMSFEDIMTKFNNSCHFVIIHRRGSESRKNEEIWKWKGEVGFCTMGLGVDFYLWIHLEESGLEEIVANFKLVKR